MTEDEIDTETAVGPETASSERTNRRRKRPYEEGGEATTLGTTDLRSAVLWGALALLALLSAYSLFQFYAFASAAINEWVTGGYRELFQAGFNLVVLLLSAIGVVLVVRQLTADRTTGTGD
jgi:hypothetical protein